MTMWLKTARFVLALVLLFAILHLGGLLARLIPLGMPESIWGLLVLFALLCAKWVKPEWIMPASRPILRYMALFFLPVCAGIVEHGAVLQSRFHALVLSNFLSTVLTLIVVGWLAEKLLNKDV